MNKTEIIVSNIDTVIDGKSVSFPMNMEKTTFDPPIEHKRMEFPPTLIPVSGKSLKTSEARKLLDGGWVLRSYKTTELKMHDYYVFNPKTRRAIYITKTIHQNLLKQRYESQHAEKK